MKIKSRLPLLSFVPVATMADITMLLIIFFLLTSTFSKDIGLDVMLPKALSAQLLPERHVTIWVTRYGEIRVNDRWVPLDQLSATLEQEFAGAGAKSVTIRGDERVPYGTIVTVMDVAKLLGVEITLAAEAAAGAPPERGSPPPPPGEAAKTDAETPR